MCNLRHKVHNGQNLPHESPNFTNFFSKQLYVQFWPFFHKSETKLQKQFFLNIFFCFILQTPGCLVTCVFGVTNFVMPKWASVQLLHGQMNLDVYNSAQTQENCARSHNRETVTFRNSAKKTLLF